MKEVVESTINNTMSLKSKVFDSIFFDTGFLGRLVTERDDRKHPNSDLWWVEGDLDMSNVHTDNHFINIGNHFIIRRSGHKTVYMKCMTCMKEPVATFPKHEKALHGYFMEHQCDGDPKKSEKLKAMTGQK